MIEDYSYFKDLTPREQLNDLMHKYAQEKGGNYSAAWAELDRRWRKNTGLPLSLQRWKYEQEYNVRMTIPEYLELTEKLEEALAIGHEMTAGKLSEKQSGWR